MLGTSCAIVSNMKSSGKKSELKVAVAFTLIELLLVIAAVVIVVAVVLPGFAPRRNHDPIIRCANNLKQVGLSFRLWAGDNGEKFPMHVPVAQGGTLELASDGRAAPHFAVMSNELGTPNILSCRADVNRQTATSFDALVDLNVSYFINLSATEQNPQAWLAGDRNMMVGRTALLGLVDVKTNTPVEWLEKIHKGRGAMAFADGSVQLLSSPMLKKSLRVQTNASSQMVFPR